MKAEDCTFGKVVQLNSGGPNMVIMAETVEGNTIIPCAWIRKEQVVSDQFNVLCLTEIAA